MTNFWKFSKVFIFFSYLIAQKWNSVFSGSSANFGEDSRIWGVKGIYSSGNRGVKKGPGPWGTRDEEFLVPSNFHISNQKLWIKLGKNQTYCRKRFSFQRKAPGQQGAGLISSFILRQQKISYKLTFFLNRIFTVLKFTCEEEIVLLFPTLM